MVERTTENRSEEVQFFPRTFKINKGPALCAGPLFNSLFLNYSKFYTFKI